MTVHMHAVANVIFFDVRISGLGVMIRPEKWSRQLIIIEGWSNMIPKPVLQLGKYLSVHR